MGDFLQENIGDPLQSGLDSITGRGRARPRGGPVIDPALLSPERIEAVIAQLSGLTGAGPQSFARESFGGIPSQGRISPGQIPVGIEQSPFFQNFQSALTDRFTPTGPENQILENIQGRTSAEFARRGLGESPVAASQTAASIAPALVQLRQNRINNLQNAVQQALGGQQLGLTQRGQDITSGVGQRGQDIQALLSGRGQDIEAGLGQRGQDISSALGQRQATMQALLQLLQFGKRTPLGQESRGGAPSLLGQTNVNLGGKIPGPGGIGS